MKAIGGYFELELTARGSYYPDAIELNTARNAFEYILKARAYRKIYVPYYTCDVILEPLLKLNIFYEFYHVDERLEPIFEYEKITSREGFLYTNYFGVKDRFISGLSLKCKNLIVDNAQSFFSKPFNGIDAFNSARKFFGVSDGAYLFIDKPLEESFDRDISYARASHLLIRTDRNAEEGYADFSLNERSLINSPIMKMSHLTHKILGSIDYDEVKRKRVENFHYLHKELGNRNLLHMDNLEGSVPMAYPFRTTNTEVRSRLLSNRVYCATYWPNVADWCKPGDLEIRLMAEVIPLPIDQRYNIEDMNTILQYLQ